MRRSPLVSLVFFASSSVAVDDWARLPMHSTREETKISKKAALRQMRNLLLASLLAILITCPWANAQVQGLQQVAQLPPELPQRVSGFAYDGEKLWAAIYQGQGLYATLDPTTLNWQIRKDAKARQAISEVSGAFHSPGALCFANGKLWIGGSYGDSFGSIDIREWTIESTFKGKQRQDSASQSYAGMAFDGNYLWIAWHWFKYKLPAAETQVLLKVEPATGKVVREYPLPPGTRNDMTHGLTFDGSMLWHAKDNKLTAIDPATGVVTTEYTLNQIKRISGLAWDGRSLWIAEFDGKIWRLPFRMG